MTVRKAAVAGQFYPGTAQAVKAALSELVDELEDKERVLAAVSPHAGWQYSGRGAGMLFSRIKIPKDVIVLCPNHRGLGSNVGIMTEGAWELPTGEVKINESLAGRILDRCDLVSDDPSSHYAEHSLEVQLPFIQHFRPDFLLTPISISRLDYQACEELGMALANAVVDEGADALVVASSDMTHFESAEAAEKKDRMAIDRILELDPEGLYDTVTKNRISMCGMIPAAVMLVYAKKRGATEARLVDYRNSGDATGDYREVVAYASIIVK